MSLTAQPPRAAAIAAALCVLPIWCAWGAQEATVRVSDLLVPVAPAGVWDLGEGLVEAAGRSDRAEADPAIRAATEARRRALAALEAVLLSLPVREGVRLGDLPVERRDAVRAAAGRAAIVGEWREPDGTLTAVARLELAGEEGLLALAAGLVAREGPERRAPERPAPAIVLVLPEDQELRPALLPGIALPDGRSVLDDPVPALRRGGVPFRYFRTREEALEALADGQSAFELTAAAAGEEHLDLALSASAAAQLERARLAWSFEVLDGVLIVAPGLVCRGPE